MKRYYSARTNPGTLTTSDLYVKLQHLFLLFKEKDYFKGKARFASGNNSTPTAFEHEAGLALGFRPFPINRWDEDEISEDHIFDMIEFLFDWVSKPGEFGEVITETGYAYNDYLNYDDAAGRGEYREKINAVLRDYKKGFELTSDGLILALGTDGLEKILNAEIVPYDEVNVDSKVRNAIAKWRNRHLNLNEQREALKELADVFEWLQKTKKLEKVLDKKDESALFQIANEFGLRHHNPKQKVNYDKGIWYSWMFHFYLATYHATIRLLLKKNQAQKL